MSRVPASDVLSNAALSIACIIWGYTNVAEVIEVIFHALEMSTRIVCQFDVTVWRVS